MWEELLTDNKMAVATFDNMQRPAAFTEDLPSGWMPKPGDIVHVRKQEDQRHMANMCSSATVVRPLPTVGDSDPIVIVLFVWGEDEEHSKEERVLLSDLRPKVKQGKQLCRTITTPLFSTQQPK